MSELATLRSMFRTLKGEERLFWAMFYILLHQRFFRDTER